MKRMWPILAIAAGLAACYLACPATHLLAVVLGDYYTQLTASSRCASMKPAPGFETDLIGTWEYGFPGDSDTLMIRADHTYKQFIYRGPSQYYDKVAYESDWQSWWVEYKADGIPYLHLSGMRLCGGERYLSCSQPGAVGYDFCSQQSVEVKNEGVLMILARSRTTDPASPRDIELTFPLGEDSWTYAQQSP